MAKKKHSTNSNKPTIGRVLKSATVEKSPDAKTWQKSFSKNVKSDYDEMEKYKLRDIDWRLKNRQNFRNFLIALLVGQNIAVFSFFGLGLYFGKLQGLESLFNVIIGGTLVETTSVIVIIVKWLFSDISYDKTTRQPTSIN